MILLAGINPNIIVQKSGKVREKERTWDAVKKALLGNVNGFLDELKGFKQNVDDGTVARNEFQRGTPIPDPGALFSRNYRKRETVLLLVCVRGSSTLSITMTLS